MSTDRRDRWRRRWRWCLAAFAVFELAAPELWAQVVINEVDYDQGGPDQADFIELYNTTHEPVDVAGFVIELVDDSTGTLEIYRRKALPAAVIAPGGYFCICADQVTTPACDVALLDGGDLLRNGPLGAVGLRDRTGVLLDALSYEGSAAAPYTEGVGVTAGDPSLVFASIGRFPDGTDSDDNSVDFIGACATPGSANVDLIGECCGDGSVNGFEECDDGPMNGRSPCGCRADCTLSPEGGACEVGPCQIGVCNASGDCLDPRPAPAGSPCGDRLDGDCTDIDTCDSDGVCAANDAADNHPCDDDPAQLDCPGLCSAGRCVTDSDGGQCLPVICGDGEVGSLEECDDGNAVPGDGCDRCLRDGGGTGGCQSGGSGTGAALLLFGVILGAARRRWDSRGEATPGAAE